jgi:hypothetical protein
VSGARCVALALFFGACGPVPEVVGQRLAGQPPGPACPSCSLVVAGLTDPYPITFDGTFFYVAEFNPGRVLSFLPDGSELTVRYQGQPYIFGIYVSGAELIFGDGQPTAQVRLPLDGGLAVEQPLSSDAGPLIGYSTAFTQNGLIIATDPGGVYAIDSAGVASLLMANPEPDVVGIVGLEGGTLFYGDGATNQMLEVPLDGGARTLIDEQVEYPWGLHVESTVARWLAADAGTVHVFDRATRQLSIWPTGQVSAHDVAEHAGRLYVTGREAGTLTLVDPADGGSQLLWRLDGGGRALNVIDTSAGLYWTNSDGTVWRLTP